MTAMCSVPLSVLQRREAGGRHKGFGSYVAGERRFTHLVLPPGCADGSSAATMSWQSRRLRTAARRSRRINYCVAETTRSLRRRDETHRREVAGVTSRLHVRLDPGGRLLPPRAQTACERRQFSATMTAMRSRLLCVAAVVRTSGGPFEVERAAENEPGRHLTV